MRLSTVEQAKSIDKISQKTYKLSAELLMEVAGSLSAREVDQSFYPELKKGTVGIVCGPGNNGGDGLVLARHLYSMGYKNIIIFILAEDRLRSPLFSLQLERAELQGLKIINLGNNWEQCEKIKSCSVVIDALFGIGLSRDISGVYLDLVDCLNATKGLVVSLDTPSGLNSDKGTICGVCVRAHMTITFGLAKPGFFVSQGPLQVGRLRVLPIGIPLEVMRESANTHFAFNEKLARRYLPTRKMTSNKSDHGRLLVIAGSEKMWGAAQLCAIAGYRIGAGYVTLASFEDPSHLAQEYPDILTDQLSDVFWDEFKKEKKYTAVCVGPGLGSDKSSSKQIALVIEKLKEIKFEKVILDADALTACVEHKLFPLLPSWIITPHCGELSKIINKDVGEIEASRFESSIDAANFTNSHVLLKGFRTVLSYEERTMIINSGNVALAKAGTGDVLSGMIAGLLAQGLPSLQAAATGSYIHGRMADEWIKSGRDGRTLMASDLSKQLPELISRLSKGSAL